MNLGKTENRRIWKSGRHVAKLLEEYLEDADLSDCFAAVSSLGCEEFGLVIAYVAAEMDQGSEKSRRRNRLARVNRRKRENPTIGAVGIMKHGIQIEFLICFLLFLSGKASSEFKKRGLDLPRNYVHVERSRWACVASWILLSSGFGSGF